MSGGVIDHVQFGRTTIVYDLVRRPGRSTVAISVTPDATVHVVAPSGTWRRKVRSLVENKAAWIIEKLDAVRRHASVPRKRLVSGETLPYLGREYQLKIVRAGADNRNGLRIERGQFRIAISPHIGREERPVVVRSVLVQWYRDRALVRIRRIAHSYSRRLGLQYQSLQIYEMKTRWGSGGPSGHLRFNWRIVMAPIRLVEYVVVHELCHLRYGHHSPAFWRTLGKVMPDYEHRRMELRHLGPRLDF